MEVLLIIRPLYIQFLFTPLKAVAIPTGEVLQLIKHLWILGKIKRIGNDINSE